MKLRNLADGVLLCLLVFLGIRFYLVHFEDQVPAQEAHNEIHQIKSDPSSDPLPLSNMLLPAPVTAKQQKSAELVPLKPLRIVASAAGPPTVVKPLKVTPRQREFSTVPEARATIEATQPQYQQQGQHLLQELEQGKGPGIEIAWPDSARQRNLLFQQLHDCEGVRVAKLHKGQLVDVEGNGTQAMSGFVRVVWGQMSVREISLLKQLSGTGTAVRLFPRQLDAAMLGGLAAIVGDDYKRSQIIRGHYQLRQGKVFISRISVDGRASGGEVRLSGVCRSSV